VARTLIAGGQYIDVPTLDEIRAEVDAAERTRLRGVKAVRVSGPGPSPAAGTLYILNGPGSGYIWSLRLISAQLASAGTVLAYISSSAPSAGATPQRLIANLSTSGTGQVATFGKAQAMLYADESVYLSATQNITAFFLAAWEVPAEMEAKLL
jgi:hypothetical protein